MTPSAGGRTGAFPPVNAAALIVRELRSESRRAANYWLRVLAATALILVFASIMLSQQPSLSHLGAALFMGLNRTLLVAFWVLVPLMTAGFGIKAKLRGVNSIVRGALGMPR